MRLTVNGVGRDAVDGLSVAGLVADLTEARRGVAVAVNGDVVPRSLWPDTPLADGDHVEVLAATQGG